MVLCRFYAFPESVVQSILKVSQRCLDFLISSIMSTCFLRKRVKK